MIETRFAKMDTLLTFDPHRSEYQTFLSRTTYLCIIGTYFITVTALTLIQRVFGLERLQREPNSKEVESCMRMAATNLVWLYFATYFSGHVIEQTMLPYDAPLPGPVHIAATIFIFCVIDDLWFYFYHRLVHKVPALYTLLHKSHHAFRVPFPAVAFAVHPLEMAILAIGTCLTPLGLFYKQMHPMVFWLWVVLRQIQVIEDHKGFEFPFWKDKSLPKMIFGGTHFHEIHHTKFKCNYASIFSIIDRIFGTAIDQ